MPPNLNGDRTKNFMPSDKFSVFLCMKLEIPDISEKLLYRSVEKSSA